VVGAKELFFRGGCREVADGSQLGLVHKGLESVATVRVGNLQQLIEFVFDFRRLARMTKTPLDVEQPRSNSQPDITPRSA